MADYELESDLESKVCNFCKKQGWLCLKLAAIAMVGFPDRTVITHVGVVFLELKRPRGGRLSKQQEHWLALLSSKLGCEAHHVSNFEQFLAVMEQHLAS